MAIIANCISKELIFKEGTDSSQWFHTIPVIHCCERVFRGRNYLKKYLNIYKTSSIHTMCSGDKPAHAICFFTRELHRAPFRSPVQTDMRGHRQKEIGHDHNTKTFKLLA